jgi:hypothetical protein
MLAHQGHGIFKENAGRPSLFVALNLAAGRVGGVGRNPGQL